MSAAESVARTLSETLPAFLPRQRWFGDKGRPIREVAVRDLAQAGEPGAPVWLAVVDVRFEAGEDARYFVPVALRSSLADDAAALGVANDAGDLAVDALSVPEFSTWAIDALARSGWLMAREGRFGWAALPGSAARLAEARRAPARLGTAEQSNSSVRYGDAVFMKVFRRMRAGINPDEEIGRFLATQSGFRRFPMPLGTARYVTADGEIFPLALAQALVPSVGDGWDYTVDRLMAGDDEHGYAPMARRLGERTGELHAALAGGSGDAAFAPEPLGPDDAAGWERRSLAVLRETRRYLDERSGALAPELRRRIDALAATMPHLERRARGFGSHVGGWKIRVHGDYHLGQTLRTPDDDWVVLDFEGEPARSIEERRAKTSALKDVAGMLRSFGYARGAALRALSPPARTAAVEDRLRRWEAAARASFVAGYRDAVGEAPIPAVPTDSVAFEAALGAWELDKALYEVAYELNNRPDWLELPLEALLKPATLAEQVDRS